MEMTKLAIPIPISVASVVASRTTIQRTLAVNSRSNRLWSTGLTLTPTKRQQQTKKVGKLLLTCHSVEMDLLPLYGVSNHFISPTVVEMPTKIPSKKSWMLLKHKKGHRSLLNLMATVIMRWT